MSKSMDLDKKPPADKSIINRIIKSGGRLLPGMVPYNSVPDSDQQSGGEELSVQDNYVDVMEWWLSEELSACKELTHPNAEKNDAKTFTQTAENLKRALYVFDRLLCERGANLQDHIVKLQEVADNINKEVNTAGVTWANVGALGLAASVGSVLFASLTRRASLAVAAVGVGVGVVAVGVSTTIINKIHTNVDRKKVETILREHSTYLEEIERCLKFINRNVECLKKYDLSTLKGERMTRVVQMAGDNVGAIGPLSKSSGLIQGFVLGLDIYFCKGDSEQLKNETEIKFAKDIRVLAKQMQASLEELMKFKTVVGSVDV
ncbi:hypothetical protein AMELA_G00167060 [Ameiurus melas]|uniref:Uncharacterized protein n=1 Tax=Ameiurus melas TaxID=219545 RepID=A0A7J6ABG8_AMEME|nr:hypothetical protein AMELA_G00167060 [Ameiurus melas]